MVSMFYSWLMFVGVCLGGHPIKLEDHTRPDKPKSLIFNSYDGKDKEKESETP